MQFLWFDLGEADPYYILPIVAGITTFIQQKISMAGMDNNPQMAMMLWMMPIMIIVFAFNFPAALSLYWVVGNIFIIVQTYFIKGPDLKAAAPVKREEQKSETSNCYRTNCRKAVESALAQLQTTEDRTEISIIDEGKKGIFGFLVHALQL